MAEYKSLYRKWRPKIFVDVFGQEHITHVLENQVTNKKVSHAYLFCGSRGTGKTTCAKIFAKAVNCERPVNGSPCNACATCLGIESGSIIDVIEIDAASNNGVENIREIREEVAFTPSNAEKKVYIIDEVHMLSTGAFNALLKTLEEPPPHIIFILATTEINKIPATVLSRCQRHDFRRFTPEIIAEKLKKVCAGENIEIEERAINLIARLANGAMRDAENILEAAIGESNKIITAEYVSKIAGHFDSEKIIKICKYIKNNDAENALIIFWEMYEASLDCGNFCGSLLEAFRNMQVAKIMREPYKYISADEREIAEIIEIARDFDNANLIRCYELVSKVFAGLTRYTANKRVAVEMMLCEMCLTIGTQLAVPATVVTVQTNATSANRPQNTVGKKVFTAYADMIEAIAKENKIVSQYMKGAVCVIDGDKIMIQVDGELKANILKENLAIIKKYADKFASGDYSVTVELQSKPDEGRNGNSIDDIEL